MSRLKEAWWCRSHAGALPRHVADRSCPPLLPLFGRPGPAAAAEEAGRRRAGATGFLGSRRQTTSAAAAGGTSAGKDVRSQPVSPPSACRRSSSTRRCSSALSWGRPPWERRPPCAGAVCGRREGLSGLTANAAPPGSPWTSKSGPNRLAEVWLWRAGRRDAVDGRGGAAAVLKSSSGEAPTASITLTLGVKFTAEAPSVASEARLTSGIICFAPASRRRSCSLIRNSTDYSVACTHCRGFKFDKPQRRPPAATPPAPTKLFATMGFSALALQPLHDAFHCAAASVLFFLVGVPAFLIGLLSGKKMNFMGMYSSLAGWPLGRWAQGSTVYRRNRRRRRRPLTLLLVCFFSGTSSLGCRPLCRRTAVQFPQMS